MFVLVIWIWDNRGIEPWLDWPPNPEGIVPSSPGLRGTSYPGICDEMAPTSNEVVSAAKQIRIFCVPHDPR